MVNIFCLRIIVFNICVVFSSVETSGITGGVQGRHSLAAFTGLGKQSYRASEDKEERGRKKGRRQKQKEKREKKKEKREKKKTEKKGKLMEGNHKACAKEGPEHATVTMVCLEHITVTTVRLGAHYSDYGALGSIFQ